MGAECVSVNKHHSTSKIKDKYTEFRNKFYHIWSENPIYKFLQQDIDLIDRSQQDLVLKGPEFFNLENFINSMPKVDDFNKNIFNHLNKLYYKQLEEVLQGSFPDVGQFFLNVVIFLLSNPNMSPKKANLAESFINCYLIRPKKPKKKKRLHHRITSLQVMTLIHPFVPMICCGTMRAAKNEQLPLLLLPVVAVIVVCEI